MAKFDEALTKLGKIFSYQGNPPNNQKEYNSMKSNIENAPTWTEVKNTMDSLPDKETKKASGKQKLIDLGLDEDEIKALIGV
tara:strand:+ start:695 stop:940 length:246 start_codon:yes stop_codon:yes gene_type:complete